jgi:ketosteroid isomerase-like protein
VSLFNAGDAPGIAKLYAENAVNHQIALEPVEGRAAIEEMRRTTAATGTVRN